MRYQKLKRLWFYPYRSFNCNYFLVILSLGVLLTMDPITQFFRGYDTVCKSDLQLKNRLTKITILIMFDY